MSESSEVRYEVREDMRGEFTALVADQDLGPVKYAATFPVSRAMLYDSAFLFPRLERWHTTATDLRTEREGSPARPVGQAGLPASG